MQHRSVFTLLAAVTMVATAPKLPAQTWTTWTSDPAGTFNGTLFGSPVTFFGNFIGGQLSNGSGTDYYSPQGAYTQNGLTAPDAGNNFGFIQFNSPVTGTIHFASPVTGLYMALISVGAPGLPVTYHFDDSFSVLSNDNTSCAFWGCGTYSTSGNSLTGTEFSGTIKFDGTVSDLSFTTDPSEFWHGITVGADAPVTTTPEPGTVVLMATGLVGLVGVRRRRRGRDERSRGAHCPATFT